MTTLELAEAIVQAVLGAAYDSGNGFMWEADRKPEREAVLEVLRENDSWFCRVSEDANGCTVETPYEQQELFT